MPGLVQPAVRPLNCAGPDEDHRGRRTALDEHLTAWKFPVTGRSRSTRELPM
jgi:hypothetical protein